ncbi:MAG: hypothetical protein JWN14_147 [Chthonomonadales bacterium]|nr:hypothetical protein [Chthonomonadales bacterium]
MLENHQPEQQGILKPSLPSNDPSLEPRIEAYLDEVCASFKPGLPEETRSALRAEMRVHLEERVAANVELGDTQKAAVSRALEQFGESKQVGRAWQRERRGTLLAKGASAKLSGRIALLLYVPSCALALFLLQVVNTIVLGMSAGYMSAQTVPTIEAISYIAAFLLPVPAGLLTGLLAHGRAVRTVFRTLCLLWLPMTVCYAFRPSAGQSPLQSAGAMLLSFGLFWIPIGCVSAGVGGWLRKQTTRLKQRLVLR